MTDKGGILSALTRRRRFLVNALFALFIAGILAYGAGFTGYMLAKFDLVNLIRDANNDDSFYYFQIAYNLAEGKFSTFDGGITRTNGYHPLWLLLITPFYWVFDKEAALFGIKAFEIMLVAGGVALVAVAVFLARLPWILLFAALPLLYWHPDPFLGLEAPAALFMLGLFFLAVMLYARNPERWKWPLAAVAFALPWVRLEYIAISLAATIALGLIEWSRQERAPGTSLRAVIISTPSRIFVPIIGSVAGILVYFTYNWLVFGGITPVSGATKQMWSQIRWEQEGGYSLAQNFRDTLQIPVFDFELLVALEICVYLLLVWWFARRCGNAREWLMLASMCGMFALAAGHIAKFAQTVLTVHPYWGSDGWYFVPAYLMMALIVPVRCYVAIYLVRRFIGPRSQRAANILSVGIVIAGAAFLIIKTDFAGPFQFVDGKSEETRQRWGVTSYMGAQVMNSVLPDDSVVGSWDAGVVGYFSRFPVVNLDGLVNSYDYLRARKEGTGAAFLQRYGITHFANVWRFREEGTGGYTLPEPRDYPDLELLERRSGDGVLFEGPPYIYNVKNAPHKRQFRILTAGPPEMLSDGGSRSVRFWERMEPRFDYQSEGVGLIVDGRMAQAFARGCAAGDLAVLVWGGPGGETSAKAWTQTATGLCVAALVLPRDTLSLVRVETMTASDYLARLVGGRQPEIRADFDAHLIGNRLVYVKEQCVKDDLAAWFFLAVYPVDEDDLPGPRKQHGFDNLDFTFDRHGADFDGICLADVPLPEYPIAEILTGQYVQVDGGFNHLWEGEIRP